MRTSRMLAWLISALAIAFALCDGVSAGGTTEGVVGSSLVGEWTAITIRYPDFNSMYNVAYVGFGPRPPAGPPYFSERGLIAFQDGELAINYYCNHCLATIIAGQVAFLGSRYLTLRGRYSSVRRAADGRLKVTWSVKFTERMRGRQPMWCSSGNGGDWFRCGTWTIR